MTSIVAIDNNGKGYIMTRTELHAASNKLFRALNALIELPSNKYRRAINDLQSEIETIDQKLAELAENKKI